MSTETVSSIQSSPVVAALQKASAATGSNFDYLLKTAMRESGMKPQAKAASSSATGLFQFVDQTWLGLVKEYGGKYGLGSSANAITKGSDGRYHVDTEADKQAILDLRNDAQTSALMAGEYANSCRTRMQSSLGRSVSDGELYAAHFLGPDAASRLIRLNDAAPSSSAAEAFPQAASANRSVFYHADGSEKSVSEVYAWATRQSSVSVAAFGEPSTEQPTVSREAMAVMMSQFETQMMTSALLSESPSGQSASAAASGLTSASGVTGGAATGLASPFSLNYGMLDAISSLQGTANTRRS